MKKRVYVITVLIVLGFGACSVKKMESKNNNWLKSIPQETCRINGGVPNSKSYFKNKNNKACDGVTYVDAQQICRDVGGKLPTIEELESISINCGADLDMSSRELMKAMRKDKHLADNYNSCLKRQYKLQHSLPPYGRYVSSSSVSEINSNKVYTHRLYNIRSTIKSHSKKSFILTNSKSTQYSVLCVSENGN